jgi:hypothetical protein
MAIDFYDALQVDFNCKALKQNFDKKFFENLYTEARRISQTAIAPISHAYYSSILVFENKDKFFVHAGSNIDPLKKENLKIAKFRNCAEKQASLSALETDRLENKQLKILFLFRLDDKIKELNSQKLLPCKDCFDKYIVDLKKNNGVLVLISEEMTANNFLTEASKIQEIRFEEEFRLIFFKGDNLSKLHLEEKLGASVNA